MTPGPDPYPLAALRDVRVAAERGATASLVAAQDEHAHALERLAAARAEELSRREELARARDASEAEISKGRLAAQTVLDGARWLEVLRARIEQACLRTAEHAHTADERAAAVEAAREALAEAVRERQAIDRHREEWEAQRKAAAERSAEAEIDELAARRRG